MKKKHSRLRIRIFYLLLLGPTLIWGLLSLTGVSAALDFDTGEKRNRHEIAEGTNAGNLTAELELYYNDRVPFRSVLLRANSGLNWLIELPYTNLIRPGLIAMANAAMPAAEENTQSAAAAGGTASEPPVKTSEEAVPAAAPSVEETVPTQASSGGETAELPQAETVPDSAETAAEAPPDPWYETPSDSGYYPYLELAPEVIQGRDGWIFTTETLADYLGSNLQTEEDLAEITANMSALDQICRERGKELFFLALPNKSTVYPEYMPSLEKTQYCALQQLEDYVRDHSGVRFSFIDQEMLSAKRNGRLYYMNDTHWNGRGAMEAVAVIHRLLGLEEIDPAALTAEEGDPVIGDLIYYTGLPQAAFVSENSVDCHYKDDVQISIVQGQTDTIDEFVSTAPDGRTAVLVGDSYRHNLMPYLSKDFAHVYYINQDVLGADCADILNSADIILVEGVERNYFFNTESVRVIPDLVQVMQQSGQAQ